jgi:phosphatidylethanolamine/phosphatidyl-N-methylethanolamine N-methyltransferase
MNPTHTPNSGQDYWNRHARNYDRSMLLLGRPIPRMIELTVAELKGAGDVLEVAAGTGLLTLPVARVARRVVATDYSEAMIGVVQQRVLQAGLTNVECSKRDVYSLGFPPASFDAVVCANVLHLLPDLPGALAALKAVLRPGGKLVAPTFCHAETLTSRAVSRVLALTGFPSQRRLSSRTLREAVEGAGLQLTRHETLPGPIPVSFVAGVSSGG